MILSNRFKKAQDFAFDLHQRQKRKGTETPYLCHLLAVASLVMENEGTEDECIAALLHDAVEDQSHHFGGAEKLIAHIQKEFGDEVIRIVLGCTDTLNSDRSAANWFDRKDSYLRHLEKCDGSVLLVSLADKCHNARAILRDVRLVGEEVFDRFKGGEEGTVWYFRELAKIFKRRLPGHPLTIVIDKTVQGFDPAFQKKQNEFF